MKRSSAVPMECAIRELSIVAYALFIDLCITLKKKSNYFAILLAVLKMKVFKFGGASVKDIAGVENVALILQSHTHIPVIVVVSAMGKTTNALERILNQFRENRDHTTELSALKHFHASIMRGLFPEKHDVFTMVDKLFSELESLLRKDGSYDEVFDGNKC